MKKRLGIIMDPTGLLARGILTPPMICLCLLFLYDKGLHNFVALVLSFPTTRSRGIGWIGPTAQCLFLAALQCSHTTLHPCCLQDNQRDSEKSKGLDKFIVKSNHNN